MGAFGPDDALSDPYSLVYLEMALILATYFSRFEMALYETDARSLEWVDHGQARNRAYVKVLAKPLER